jgi:hypothetical protein
MNFEAIKDWVFNVGGIFILWILLHYISANLYASYCAEYSILGLIKSIFVAEAPHCVAMRWMIYHGGSAIHSMWVSIGLWIMGKIFAKCINKEKTS